MAIRAALASGGNTTAYLAGGVDRFYLSGHDTLRAYIVDRGQSYPRYQCRAPLRK